MIAADLILNALHLGHHRAGARSGDEMTSTEFGTPSGTSIGTEAPEPVGKAIFGTHPFSLTATPEAFWKARAKGRTALRMLGGRTTTQTRWPC